MQIVSQRTGISLPSVAVPLPSVIARSAARGHQGGVFRVMFARDDQAAIGAVFQIGVEFRDEPVPARGVDLLVQSAGHAQKRHLEDIGGIADGMGDVLLPRRHAVKAAVRLDMVQRHPLGLQKPAERADLVDQAVGHLLPVHLHLAPAKALQIGQAGMRADLHPMLLGQLNCRPHVVEVAGMKAASDVGDMDQWHQPGVIAHAIQAHSFRPCHN